MSRPNWRKGKAPESSSQPSQPSTNSENAISSTSTEIVRAGPIRENRRSSPLIEGDVVSANPQDSTSIVFYDVCTDFACACAEVWPSDLIVVNESKRLVSQGTSNEAKKVEGLKLAKAFHAAFVEHYSLIVAKKGEFFSLPIDFMVKVHASSKYANSPADVRETVWEYLRSLVQYAGMVDMYSKCPQAMLDSITGVAGGLIAKLQSGEMDPNNLNPMVLGQMMMQQMSSEDLEGFGQAIMEGGNMESMMSIMQSTMASGGIPGMPAGMSNMMGAMGGMRGGAMPDIGSLMSMMGNMKK